MGNVMGLGEFYLLSLALGVGFFSFLANPQETGGGFLKMVASLCAGSTLLCLSFYLTRGSLLSEQSLVLTVALIAFIMIYVFHGDTKSYGMRLMYITHNTCLALAMLNFFNNDISHFIYAFSSCMLLGSVTYAMVMGHWYLVTPRLSERPLLYATYFMWLIMLIKVIWTVKNYLVMESYFISGTYEGAGYLFNWLMLTMRVGWGYLVIAIMSYFSYRLIKMRSIQSATGMLYAMTFFVFIGELVSMYMFLEYGMKL